MFLTSKPALYPLTLLALTSSLALAQQPQWPFPVWPTIHYWATPQYWGMPIPGPALPFPTPFWLWPKPSAPAAGSAVEPIPPQAGEPQPAAIPTPARTAEPRPAIDIPTEIAKESVNSAEGLPLIPAPSPPETEQSIAVAPEPMLGQTPLPAPSTTETAATSEMAIPPAAESAPPVTGSAASETAAALTSPSTPAPETDLPTSTSNLAPPETVAIEATPTAASKPVTVKKPRVSKKPAKKPLRKLCWKDGKLDVCP